MLSLLVSLGVILVPFGLILGFVVVRTRRNRRLSRRVAYAMLILNTLGLGLLFVLSLSLVTRVFAMGVLGPASQGLSAEAGLGLIGAGLSTGLAAIGAGIGAGWTGAAAIGAIAEKPELLGRSLVFVGLAEGIAIYGLIISILILGRI